MKFNFNDYKGKYAMNCKTEEEAQEFCRLMHEDGRCWDGVYTYWDTNKSATCYNFNIGTFGHKDFYIENDYAILEWENFKEEPIVSDYMLKANIKMQENFKSLCKAFADIGFPVKPTLPTFTEDVLRGYKSIYIDGVTIAIPMETIVGIAYKNPDDEHDPEFGEALAYFRMEGENELY